MADRSLDDLADALRAVDGLKVAERTSPQGHRYLHVKNRESGLLDTRVRVVDEHYAIELTSSTDLVAIATVDQLDEAVRRVRHQVAPAATAP